MRNIKAFTFHISGYNMMPQKLINDWRREVHLQIYDEYHEQIKVLKEEVKGMLLDATINPNEKINLINLLDRLSLSYHFENEIEDQLEQIFNARANSDGCDYDLYTISLQFRIFRQHGYKMSCGKCALQIKQKEEAIPMFLCNFQTFRTHILHVNMLKKSSETSCILSISVLFMINFYFVDWGQHDLINSYCILSWMNYMI